MSDIASLKSYQLEAIAAYIYISMQLKIINAQCKYKM